MVKRCSPRVTYAVALNTLQELPSLAFLSDVNMAFFLVVWKLFEAVCCCHSFEAVQFIISSSIYRVLCKGVDMDFEIA